MDEKKNIKKLPAGIRAALIDMDGVIYDSMPYHAKAWHKMMEEQGIKTKEDEFYLYEGMTGGATINLIFERELGRPATDEEKSKLYERKSQIFISSGKKKMMPGASDMLRAFLQNDIITVLVTGSAQGSLLNSLEEDYPGFFPIDRRVTALDVKNGKPHPEPYLKGIEKSGVKKEETIVIENAPLGVRAGKNAGCFTIAVTTGPIPKEEFEKEGADMIFSSMEEFSEWLDKELPKDPGRRIENCIRELNPATVNVVTDKNVMEQVMPRLYTSASIRDAKITVLQPGENQKNITSVDKIWNDLETAGATRKSLIVNVGGGMVTDIGGFAAATFKRGIRYVNFPTTLLGAVDAATGGKTGINFNGLKNEIGAFHKPTEVVISSEPLSTLPVDELMSGYAEMIKTALIADKNLYEILLDVNRVISDSEILEKVMLKCVEIKENIVREDPFEKGLRKILNFGHTAGHAFESLAIEKGIHIPHGVAVAHGMLVELILSHILKGFPSNEVTRYAVSYLKPHYKILTFDCEDMENLIDFMKHDKKNKVAGNPNFTLLEGIGKPEIDVLPTLNEIRTALDIYNDYMG